MGKLLRRLLWGCLLGVAIYAALAIYLGVAELGQSLAQFAWWRLAPVLALTLGNYLLRYLKWSTYLRVLKIDVPTKQNAVIFLGGLSMTITPGKIGELLKAYLLRTAQGVPMARTLPVVIAERITDLLALVVLMSGGIVAFGRGHTAALIVGCSVLLFIVVVGQRRLSLGLLHLIARLPGLSGFSHKLEEFYESTHRLFRPGPLLVAALLSVAAWACECAGFCLVLGGFPSTVVGLLLATFIYSATTIGGLPTPGGLGLTEGGMTALLAYTAKIDRHVAGAATLIIRLCTLWFAVIVGVIALFAFRRSVGLADDAAERMMDSR
ncbi:MAG: flippase-like domain-containing protein [Deltaproteobacteria bacterium]|nr:flippase-like domain-containing protein [Deltaproteobacteria bacterium]